MADSTTRFAPILTSRQRRHPVELPEDPTGVKTRKCQNCPVREAAATFPRSAILVETGFSRCQKAII